MASTRSLSADLLRLFDRLDDPVYLIDNDYRLRFVNRSAAAWTGFSAEELIGTTIRYDSASTQPAAVEAPPQETATRINPLQLGANGLCPPPDAFISRPETPETSTALTFRGLVYAIDRAGVLRRRLAQFMPLAVDGEIDLVLARLATVDLPDFDSSNVASPSNVDNQAAGSAIVEPSMFSESHRLHDQLIQFRTSQSSQFQLDRLVGSSPAIRRVRAQVKLAIAGQSHACICGPPGTGKQLVATIIHQATNGASPLHLIDCAVLDFDAIRSLLSGLVATSRGQRLTMLLRDFQLTGPDVQVELQRLLEDRANDICILVTSTRTIEQLTTETGLRPQLAAVLGALVIELPPLAFRRQDIPLLAQALLEATNARTTKQLRGLSVECIDQLVRYTWPQNIDELAACIRAAHAQAEGIEIVAADLPKRMHYAAEAARRPARVADEPIDMETLLATVETQLIERALKSAKGNKAQAARLLSLTRPKLYRRMVQLNMEPAEADQPEESQRDIAQAAAKKRPKRKVTDEPPEFIEDLPFEEEPQ